MLGRAARGNIVVEFALMITLLMILAFGVFEFGRALHIQIVLYQAAREGARYAMDLTKTKAQIETVAVNAAAPLTVTATCVNPCTSPQRQVNVSHAFTSNVWFVGSFDIRASMVSHVQ